MAERTDNRWSVNGYGQQVNKQLVSGKFSKEESEIVRQAVHEFCAAKEVTVDRLCSECEHKAELKGAWNEISKSLPNRSVQSVYRHGLRLCHPFRRGIWTEDEINKLMEIVTRLGKKWVACQKSLNRSADSCRDKYREMSDVYVKGRWKENETQQLTKLIRQHLQSDPSMQIIDIGKMVEAEAIVIPWSTISRKMGNRSRLSCFKKFQKMTGLFSASDIGIKRRAGGELPPHLQGQGQSRSLVEFPISESLAENMVPTRASLPQQQQQPSPPSPPPQHQHQPPPQQHHQHQHRIEDVGPASGGGGAAAADLDMFLLSELAGSGANRSSEIEWDTLRGVDDGQDRWNDLVMEWQQQEGDDATEDALLTLPFYELAQLLLDRKASAKMAAETVEAVDLPII